MNKFQSKEFYEKYKKCMNSVLTGPNPTNQPNSQIIFQKKSPTQHCSMILLEILQLTTSLQMSTVNAYRFYTKLLFSIRSKVIGYAIKCNLAKNLQASTVEIYNKVVSYRPTIHRNSEDFLKRTLVAAAGFIRSIVVIIMMTGGHDPILRLRNYQVVVCSTKKQRWEWGFHSKKGRGRPMRQQWFQVEN